MIWRFMTPRFRSAFPVGANHLALTVAAGMLLSASACQTPRQTAQQSRPGGATVDVIPPVDVTDTTPSRGEIEHAVVSEHPHGSQPIELLGHEDRSVATDNSGNATDAVETVTSARPVWAGEGDPCRPIPHGHNPRVALPPADFCAVCDDGTLAGPYPEELICDGGDRAYPFHYEGYDIAGLDTEDTVGEFINEDGEREVRISTRACVYAPRFGSVRTISQPVADHSIAKLGGVHDRLPASGFETTQNPEVGRQADQLNTARVRSRASGLALETAEMGLHLTVGAEEHHKVQNIGEDRQTTRSVQVDKTEEATQAYVVQTAGVWSKDDSPIIIGYDQSGQEVHGRRMAQDYTGVEDQRTPGDLAIIKEADRDSAQPGETVTFTIRFKNTGERELSRVRIMDHLTTRVEYVRGSAFSELDGGLTLEEEPDGSQVIIFELAEPLAGEAEGEITFQVKLR
ncbi:MAG: DUF11 domain-containing protein [Planctomycetota bacterium]|nr:MAG: DUF11 domain-containing protein [Planctomycetota bacterium]REK24353.1 MAG: DUF11 domain-containing protein [Planctomycetota bacterium]REK38544.1 MAG: DUF11 domain-containing protein [Planctomycetota bacterium]